jgi:transcriptional regulator with PAS, ATPase and Fis domain
MSKYITGVSGDVLELLMNYNYTGNIRELENIIEHAFVMCQEEIIQLKHLPPEVSLPKQKKIDCNAQNAPLEVFERKTIQEVLEKHHWNKIEAAKELNLHRSTLWRKMKKFSLA